MKYYHLHDCQVGGELYSGRNSESKEEAKEGLLSYLSIDHDEDELAELAKLPPDELAEMFGFAIMETNFKLPED